MAGTAIPAIVSAEGYVQKIASLTTLDTTYLSTVAIGKGGTGQTTLAGAKLVLGIPTMLFSRYADATTTGIASFESFYNNTIASNTLKTDGDTINAMYSGVFAANGNTKSLKLLLGGTSIFENSSFDDIVANNKHWKLDVTIIRVSNTVVRCCAALLFTGMTIPVWPRYTEITGLTLATTAYDMNLQGQTDTAGDVTAKMGQAIYYPV